MGQVAVCALSQTQQRKTIILMETQKTVEVLTDSFHLAFCLCVVNCWDKGRGAKKVEKFLSELRNELGILIWNDAHQHAVIQEDLWSFTGRQNSVAENKMGYLGRVTERITECLWLHGKPEWSTKGGLRMRGMGRGWRMPTGPASDFFMWAQRSHDLTWSASLTDVEYYQKYLAIMFQV